MKTICPRCHAQGHRVEMVREDLPQPSLLPKGDRFPGKPFLAPLVYYYEAKWTCPECKFEVCE